MCSPAMGLCGHLAANKCSRPYSKSSGVREALPQAIPRVTWTAAGFSHLIPRRWCLLLWELLAVPHSPLSCPKHCCMTVPSQLLHRISTANFSPTVSWERSSSPFLLSSSSGQNPRCLFPLQPSWISPLNSLIIHSACKSMLPHCHAFVNFLLFSLLISSSVLLWSKKIHGMIF